MLVFNVYIAMCVFVCMGVWVYVSNRVANQHTRMHCARLWELHGVCIHSSFHTT